MEGQSGFQKHQSLAGMSWGSRDGGKSGKGGRKLECRPPPGHLCPLGLETSIGF